MAAVGIDVEELTDSSPIGRLQILVAALGTLVIFVDGFDTQVMGYIAPQLAKAWGIPRESLGPIFSSGLSGVFIGYLFSPLSGRFGHRLMMIACTSVFGVLTLVTTLAPNADILIALRFVTGIALGAAYPSAVSIIADFCPKSRRSTFIVIGICGVSLGSMFAGLVSGLLSETFGWQSVLLVGGVLPLGVAGLLAGFLPDSLEHLVRNRRDQRAALTLARRIDPNRSFAVDTTFVIEEKASRSVTQVFASGRLAGTLAVWISFAANLLVFFFVQSWLTTLIVQQGHTQQVAIAATTVLTAGGVVSIFVFGPLMDKYQPYKVIGLFFVVGGAAVALLGSLLSASPPLLFAGCFFVGIIVLGVQKGVNAVAIFYYPMALRSTGLGWAIGAGRLGAVAGPLIAGWMMQGGRASASLFYLSSIPMMAGAAAMFFLSLRYGASSRSRRPDASRLEDEFPAGPNSRRRFRF